VVEKYWEHSAECAARTTQAPLTPRNGRLGSRIKNQMSRRSPRR
jgi:hypothetical protein